MQRVLVIINNPKQASYRLRIEALIEPLALSGFELVVRVRPRGWLARRKLLRSAGEYAQVVLQRKLLDPSDARLLGRHARRVLFDVDDAVMRHDGPAGWVSRWRTRRRFLATARSLDHVVAGNELLAGLFAERGCATSIIPTVVDPADYVVKKHAPTDAPTLVWIGSKSTLSYLRDVEAALAQASARVPGLRLLTIADRTLEPCAIPVEHVAWSKQTEATALVRGDIGIAPTPHTPWTEGKCGFKIVQYMACGLPVIASPVGANAQIIRPEQTGFLPASVDEWPALIERLCEDVALRQSMGQAGRERVEATYSISAAVQRWVEVLSA